MAPCSPWVTDESVALCTADGFTDGYLAKATAAATDLLWAASGRQFSGVCTDAIRPCGAGCASQWLAYPPNIGGSRPLPLLRGDCGCGEGDGDLIGCGCGGHPAVRLPNTPVIDVLAVTIGGVALDPPPVGIVDDVWLTRRDGQRWPCCQRFDLPATQPGTWEIRYRWGVAVPASGLIAAEVLACELAKGWSDKPCRLPKRLTNITREGLSATVLDPFEFLDEGRFGIYEVDGFVSTYNPGRLEEPARIIDPVKAARRARRVR